MEHPKPQAEHRWLQKLVGEWTYEMEASMGPDGGTEVLSGSETVRPLGEMWVMAESTFVSPAGPAAHCFTFGYDPDKGHFVGTFIGSTMPSLWLYEGTLDAEGRTLTLESEGPSFAGDGTIALYRDVIEVQSPSERTLTSYHQVEDGSWQSFMTMRYRRA